jgi:hypothetical protein
MKDLPPLPVADAVLKTATMPLSPGAPVWK